MSFLSPLLLWFLAAASVPVIIHLINRRRHKTIQWAAMQFLLKASRESRGKKKLRHILILTCRALGIAALALAAARPIVSGLIGWGAGSIDTVVLILDRSASMEVKPGDGLQSRRQIAIANVKDAIADLGGARLVLIDSATATPQEVPSPDTLGDISSTAATDTAADLPSLLAKAAEYLAESTGRAEIWIASDLQTTNWKPNDERWAAARASLAALPQKTAVRVLSLTGNTTADSTILIHGARRSASELLVDLEILRSGTARGTTNLPLTTHLNGSSTTESLTIPGQSIRFQKRVALPPDSETGHGWLSLPADGNPRGNAAFFAYGPDRPIRTLVVAPQGETADYLTLAAAPPAYGNLQTVRTDRASAHTAITPDLAAILWAAPLPEDEAYIATEKFLNDGGHVLFLPPATASPLQFNTITWADPSDSPTGKFFILQDWNRADGPLRDGIDGTPVAAKRLRAIRRQIPQGDVTPLARWEDGEPALIRRIFDHGTAWFIGTLPDYTWSNLGDADVLLPAVQRIITAGANRFDASYLTTVGSETAKLRPGETRTRLDSYGTPDPANSPHTAGIWKLGDRLLAINTPHQETLPEILSKDELDAVLADTGFTLLDQAGQSTDPTISRDIWRAFLIACLLFLLAELLLCLPKKQPLTVGTPTTTRPGESRPMSG
ncbi:MAG: vWA domain-containing protein [Verrucomicrobiota bacterium JB025]|nr:BatA and WFA domain-containing protein [Verrucomicrobiota bacterium JB025]